MKLHISHLYTKKYINLGVLALLVISALTIGSVTIKSQQDIRQHASGAVCQALPVHVPVLVLGYFPPDPKNPTQLDPVETGWTPALLQQYTGASSMPITTWKTIVSDVAVKGADFISDATRYHGYSNPTAPRFLNYDILTTKFYDNAVPHSNENIGKEDGVHDTIRPDYRKILTDNSVCHYVDDLGVKEVWIYSNHTPYVSGDESRLSSKYGDISNAFPVAAGLADNNINPVCKHSYIMYNFEMWPWAGWFANNVHNRMHQIENEMSYLSDSYQITWPRPAINPSNGFWNNFALTQGSPSSLVALTSSQSACGNTHVPPNASLPYHYGDTTSVNSNCETWNPDVTKTTYKTMTCQEWGCTDIGYYKWWMQNLPGYNNGITYKGKAMRNWWEAMYDFNAFVDQGGRTLYGDASIICPSSLQTQPGAAGSVDRSGTFATGVDLNGMVLNNTPAYMLDGNVSTSWSAGATQKAVPLFGAPQTMLLTFATPKTFNEIDLSTDPILAPYSFPVGYSVSTSVDNLTWTSPIATGVGTPVNTKITFPRLSAQFVKITQTGVSTTQPWSVGEVNLFDRGILTNTGWTATASSTNGNNTPNRVFDSNLVSYWMTPNVQTPGDSFTIDMHAEQMVNEVFLNNLWIPRSNSTQVGVSLSHDGTVWQSIPSNTLNAKSTISTDITFATQSARYIKLTQLSTGISQWAINELSIYGIPPVIVTPTNTPTPTPTKVPTPTFTVTPTPTKAPTPTPTKVPTPTLTKAPTPTPTKAPTPTPTKAPTPTLTKVPTPTPAVHILSRAGWQVTASSTQPTNALQWAIDGSLTTRWSTGKNQVSGQWFQVDMGKAQNISQLVMDAGSSIYDYPQTYQVFVSNNPLSWGNAIAQGNGSIVTIVKFATYNVRYIKIVQIGTKPYYWSMFEFNVYGM